MYDITLLTDSRYVAPGDPGWYEQNILLEDQMVTASLKQLGLRVTRTNWDNPQFDWKQTRAVVFRTTWDYFYRFHEFDTWLERVSSETQLINPLPIIRWNMDKHYLLDLQQRQINIPPTVIIEKQDQRPLSEIALSTSWKEFILKPAVSGAARHTYRFTMAELFMHEEIYRQLVSNEAMLLQEFQEHVLTMGEAALMFFDGQYSHAILKKVKPGDFRVQDDFGGSVHDFIPSKDEVRVAENAVAACSRRPAYARVDLMWDREGKPCVSELELIEPELWLRTYPPAATAFALAIQSALRR
jgi:glutathione synthase/RimK-type ligase-like ATP-grasp enzyme